MKVCFKTLLDGEGFLKRLDNTVDYKLYSLSLVAIKKTCVVEKRKHYVIKIFMIFGTKFYHLRQFSKQ